MPLKTKFCLDFYENIEEQCAITSINYWKCVLTIYRNTFELPEIVYLVDFVSDYPETCFVSRE